MILFQKNLIHYDTSSTTSNVVATFSVIQKCFKYVKYTFYHNRISLINIKFVCSTRGLPHYWLSRKFTINFGLFQNLQFVDFRARQNCFFFFFFCLVIFSVLSLKIGETSLIRSIIDSLYRRKCAQIRLTSSVVRALLIVFSSAA